MCNYPFPFYFKNNKEKTATFNNKPLAAANFWTTLYFIVFSFFAKQKPKIN